MQTKSITRNYHYITVRMAKIYKDQTKFWQGCEATRTLIYRWWECKMVQILWETFWQFLKN